MTPHMSARKHTTLMAVWGLLIAAAGRPAAADIVNVSGLNTAVNGHLNVDVNGDGVTDVTLQNQSSLAGTDLLGNLFFNRNVGATGSVAGATVAPGTLIGPGLLYSATSTLDSTLANLIPGLLGSYSFNNAALGSNLLLPFKFVVGSQTDYGWLNVSITDPGSQNPYNLILNGYGYDNTGSPVAAGAAACSTAVPEPGGASLALVGFGVLSVAVYRRRRAVCVRLAKRLR